MLTPISVVTPAYRQFALACKVAYNASRGYYLSLPAPDLNSTGVYTTVYSVVCTMSIIN